MGVVLLGLKKEKYNKRIKIYYYSRFPENVIKKVIRVFRKENLAGNCVLVRDRQGRQVFKFVVNRQVYYLKVFKYRKAKKVIKNLFRSEEAVRSLKKIYKLSTVGIPIVEPAAAITFRRGLFIYDSVLITKEHKSMTLWEYILKENTSQILKEKIIRNMGKLWSDLFNNNFIHKDYNLANFMIDTANHMLFLADIDNIYSTPILMEKLIIRNLAKFYARLLVDFVGHDLELLSYEERDLFFKEFLRDYKKDIEFKEFVNEVNKGTIKRLIEKGRKDLISYDKWLT